MAGGYEYDSEPSGAIKVREFLDQMSDSWLFRKESAPWSELRIEEHKLRINYNRVLREFF